jgi:anti-sigma-K factor RskA
MFMVASQVPPPQAPIVVVLGANPEAAQALTASFVASVSADGRALVLKPLNDLSLTPGRALELWAVPATGAPRSLGLVQTRGATTLLRAQLLRDTAAFAVSVEPTGGSPTGAPTGPIVSLGKLQL